MLVFKKIKDMQEFSENQRMLGKRIAFVPTMGYLHKGHEKLIERAKDLGDLVVVSIFVNPTQFGPSEDFNRYPRDWERDRSILESHHVDAVFFPDVEEMYPEGYQTYVTVEELSRPLCGAFRPGHFRGVATVVLKLFNIVKPHFAVFGEKDYQQLLVIKRMVSDLNLDVRIIGYPTVREEDGLAMSSRNLYLNEKERKAALVLSRSLKKARELYRMGLRNPEALRNELIEEIKKEPLVRLQYLEICSSKDLKPVMEIGPDTLVAIAAFVGNARLIDNCIIGG